ncbi:hypothetical protein [Lentzea sp. NPDC092896]|uniref:hypothetical protein n=1 Tax=Lentzea sp. NPDC092896 TaxID=3364127 RepID=UPI003813B262
MSDLRTLHDAFAELERQVDAEAAYRAPVVRRRRAVRLVPVAATVVAVACLAAGVVWLLPADSGTQIADPPTALSTTPARNPVPTSPDDLIARFRVVLGDTATFDATMKTTVPGGSPSRNPEPPGTGSAGTPQPADLGPNPTALVGGTLTSAGITGSFALTIHPSRSEPSEWCRLARTENCDVTTLPDGSRLATGTGRPDTGAVSHMACIERPDGTMILLHVGNQEDPRGTVVGTPGGRIFSPQPPLTVEQMKAIVTSGKW